MRLAVRIVLNGFVALIALIASLANYRHLSSAYGGPQQIPRQWRSWRTSSQRICCLNNLLQIAAFEERLFLGKKCV